MSKTLIVQTDCTGKYHHHLGIDTPHQPHLVRLAWLTTDDEDNVLSTPCTLVLPRADWRYDPDQSVGHLVTRELGQSYGVPLEKVMARFVSALKMTDTIVAYNWSFHSKMLQRSAYECGMLWEDMFDQHHQVCAMREATDIVQVPRMLPGGGYLWPKMTAAYEFFTGEEMPVDIDPIQRGLTLVTAVHRIYQGILETQRSTPHE